ALTSSGRPLAASVIGLSLLVSFSALVKSNFLIVGGVTVCAVLTDLMIRREKKTALLLGALVFSFFLRAGSQRDKVQTTWVLFFHTSSLSPKDTIRQLAWMDWRCCEGAERLRFCSLWAVSGSELPLYSRLPNWTLNLAQRIAR